MFLNTTIQKNRALVEFAFWAQRSGAILPDTYLLDLDTLEENAQLIQHEADAAGVSLYFMLKQIGRIPDVAKRLMEIGYSGAVCVDYREALTMMRAGVPLGHVGHLVQTPRAALEQILASHPQIMTVYSLEKAAEINAVCSKLGYIQPIMLRVLGKQDILYPGQYGGFALENMEATIAHLQTLKNIRIAGVCSFPCLLYNEERQDIVPTPNMQTVREGAAFLKKAGYQNLQLNMPSATCMHSIKLIAQNGGTHAEPGHGLTGTTPYHAVCSADEERPALVYVSEVSHNLGDKAYCYGGGHYRRGHLQHGLVGTSIDDARLMDVTPPTDESIDYHFELSENAHVSDAVVMSFRTQIFVTRSEVAIVSGISKGKPQICGVYSSLGEKLK